MQLKFILIELIFIECSLFFEEPGSHDLSEEEKKLVRNEFLIKF